MFFTNVMTKGGIIGAGDKFFPCFTATIAAALFFVLINALQVPLAFTADATQSRWRWAPLPRSS